MPTGEGVTLIKSFSGNYAEITTSGELRVSLATGANITVDISGDVVTVSGNVIRNAQGSGANAIYITNQSGNVSAALTDGGAQIITGSGDAYALWGASGRNATYITNQSGNLAVNVADAGDGVTAAVGRGMYTQSILMARQNTVSTWDTVKGSESGSALSQGGARMRLFTDTTQAGATVRAGKTSCIGAGAGGSGGTQLGNVQVIHGVTIKNLSGNGPVWVGGIGANAPFADTGFPLQAPMSGNETQIYLQVQSLSGVRVYANTSGQFVSWIGVDF